VSACGRGYNSPWHSIESRAEIFVHGLKPDIAPRPFGANFAYNFGLTKCQFGAIIDASRAGCGVFDTFRRNLVR
jgi:hypothetical protein